ncbi:MAG: hypothetical protein H9W81_13730 [Enterococcus sp.]|nr:hypothetical protein [Enterococcus sp.]
MSYHAEHVIWKSMDGTWAYGRYKRISNDDNPNAWRDGSYDSEWDDDFDYHEFSFAANGFPTAEAADSHMRRKFVNPGHTGFETKAKVAERKYWDEMLYALNNPAYAAELRKKREHAEMLAFRKKVREDTRAMNLREGKTYTVQFSSDGPAKSHLGIFHYLKGTLKKHNDWLCLETTVTTKAGVRKRVTVKVWNQKTRTQAPTVAEVREEPITYRWR